jgi:hypothetical protein
VTGAKISEDDCKVMLGRVAKQINGNSVLGAVLVRDAAGGINFRVPLLAVKF